MNEQKTLLQQIREKESFLNTGIESVEKETENMILNVKGEAEKLIKNSELEGIKASQEYFHQESKKIDLELDMLKGQAKIEADAIRESSEKKLPYAVDIIVKAVLGIDT
jgi:vacuolar-type H+-ATPase subunit H